MSGFSDKDKIKLRALLDQPPGMTDNARRAHAGWSRVALFTAVLIGGSLAMSTASGLLGDGLAVMALQRDTAPDRATYAALIEQGEPHWKAVCIARALHDGRVGSTAWAEWCIHGARLKWERTE